MKLLDPSVGASVINLAHLSIQNTNTGNGKKTIRILHDSMKAH